MHIKRRTRHPYPRHTHHHHHPRRLCLFPPSAPSHSHPNHHPPTPQKPSIGPPPPPGRRRRELLRRGGLLRVFTPTRRASRRRFCTTSPYWGRRGVGQAVEMDGEGVSVVMGGCCCSTRRTSQPRPWLPPHTPYQQPSPPMSIKSIPDAGGVNTPPPHTHTLPRYQTTNQINP